jgi:hypothetical protein
MKRRRYQLPEVLREIAEAAGVEAALKVASEKGGTRAYFPAKPAPDHWLSDLVGLDKARTIGKVLAPGQSGIELEVPMGPNMSQARRWKLIHNMAASHSKPAIARAAGCHYKTVQRILNGKRRTVSLIISQGDLFE